MAQCVTEKDLEVESILTALGGGEREVEASHVVLDDEEVENVVSDEGPYVYLIAEGEEEPEAPGGHPVVEGVTETDVSAAVVQCESRPTSSSNSGVISF